MLRSSSAPFADMPNNDSRLLPRLCFSAITLLCAGGASLAADIKSGSTAWIDAETYSLSQRAFHPSDEYSIFDTFLDESIGQFTGSFAASSNQQLNLLTRLETAWSGTLPFTSATMRIGDGVSYPGAWGQAVRFGGVHIGTINDLPSDLVTAPELTAGQSVLFSSVDLLTQDIQRIERFNSARNVTLAVNDVLGRRREVAAPLHTDIVIAPKGKTDYSLSAGRIREDFALADGEYGARFASLTVRHGLRKSLTLDAHASTLEGVATTMGAMLAKDTGDCGKVSAAVAGSRNAAATEPHAVADGWLARLAYQVSHEYLDFALRARVQSPTYRDAYAFTAIAADSLSETVLRSRALASVTLKMGLLGDLLLAGAVQTFHDESRADFVSVRHSMPFGPAGSLAASFAYNTRQSEAATAQLSFTHQVSWKR